MYLSVIVLPLLAALVATTIRHQNLRDGLQLLLACLLTWQGVELMRALLGGTLAPLTLFEPLPGLALHFEADGFGILFLVMVALLWAVALLYSIGYMRANSEAHQGRFFAFYAVAIAATSGIAISGNMLTLFLFYELLTLSTFPLVTHHGTPEARKAGRTYLLLLLGTSALLLAAIIWTRAIAGTTQFSRTGLLAGISPAITGPLLLLYMFGIGKAALMPFHRWLPAAMTAPVPVSALLHAVAVVKAGVFTALKVIVFIFGLKHLQDMVQEHWWASGWLTLVAGITLILSSIIALKEDNLKRMLAYSTISQLALILFAVSLYSGIGFMVAAFHIAAHAFGKITLFFAAGSISTVTGKTRISELAGIGRRMPWTMGAFAVGAAAMIGLFPAAGFYLKYALLHSNASQAVSVLLWGSLILNACYFLPVLHVAFFRREKKKAPKKEAPRPMLLATLIAAILSLLPCIVLWTESAPVRLPAFPEILWVLGLPWLVAFGTYFAYLKVKGHPELQRIDNMLFGTLARAEHVRILTLAHTHSLAECCLKKCRMLNGSDISATALYAGMMLAVLLLFFLQ